MSNRVRKIDPTPASTDVLVRKYGRPAYETIGSDRIPDYINAERDDPRRYHPPEGKRLVVRCNGDVLRYVVEANRKEGWARCLHVLELPGGQVEYLRDPSDGRQLFKAYNGRVTFALVRA
jgi:hypothetical protein